MLLRDGERNWGRNSLILQKRVGKRRQCCEGGKEGWCRNERQNRDKSRDRRMWMTRHTREGLGTRTEGEEMESAEDGECDEIGHWANAEIEDPPFARYDKVRGSARIMQRNSPGEMRCGPTSGVPAFYTLHMHSARYRLSIF